MSGYILRVLLLAGLISTGLTSSADAADKGKAASIKKAKGGYTVEEVITQKDKLSGKKVSVRGKVVKFNSGIMGKNWIHLQDGSGKQGTDDLTITTKDNAQSGDTVLITGTLGTDKDFGGGYHYAVIVEDATVKVE